MNTKVSLSKKLYCVMLVLFPILHIYASPISIISLSEFLILIVLVVCFILEKDKSIKFCRGFYFFILYLIFSMFLNIFYINSSLLSDSVGTTLRLLFMYGILVISINNFFDFTFTKKVLNVVSVILSIYAILQIVFYNFGIYLYNYIPFLKSFNGGVTYETSVLEQVRWGQEFRAYSLFREPAAVGCYLTLPLILNLFSREKGAKKWILITIFSIALICSKSSTAIIMLIISIVIYIMFYSNNSKEHFSLKIIGLILALVVMGTLMFITNVGNYFLVKTFGENMEFSGIKDSSRFYALQMIFSSDRGVVNVIFGSSLAKTDEYLPGLASVYYSLGIIGFLLFVAQFFYGWNNKASIQKILVLVFLILNIGTEIALGSFIMIYYPFIFANQLLDEKHVAYSSNISELSYKSI